MAPPRRLDRIRSHHSTRKISREPLANEDPMLLLAVDMCLVLPGTSAIMERVWWERTTSRSRRQVRGFPWPPT
ncbi:hypothetical protein BV20DRAFT_812374 [Pilatotrama ljubarskyi]|nr:hypothetical protein BV20DRAFT_812374 [Pilatotrama ljubarskyi]